MNALPYLTFNGNCLEAMTFYKKCLGGKLSFKKVGDSPLASKMPKTMKDAILHSTLLKKDLALMGSDMVGENGLSKGNSVSIMLDCENEKEIKSIYKKLSKNGKQIHPIEKTFFGGLLGNLTDKYGNHWLLHYKNN